MRVVYLLVALNVQCCKEKNVTRVRSLTLTLFKDVV